jgi:hypothetical protein
MHVVGFDAWRRHHQTRVLTESWFQNTTLATAEAAEATEATKFLQEKTLRVFRVPVTW